MSIPELYAREILLWRVANMSDFLVEELKELNARIHEDDTETALRFADMRYVIDGAFDNLKSSAYANRTKSRTSDCDSGTRVGTTGQH